LGKLRKRGDSRNSDGSQDRAPYERACHCHDLRKQSNTRGRTGRHASFVGAFVMLARPITLGIAIAAAAALTLGGCATKYNGYGERIYIFQFGQDVQREVDYSNPRLPILPKWRPNTDLWPVPSPWQFNDLSRYSMLDDRAPVWLAPTLAELRCSLPPEGAQFAPWGGPAARTIAPFAVGDNADCAACNESTARLALLALRADARGASSAL
jgi:hypothetical protein